MTNRVLSVAPNYAHTCESLTTPSTKSAPFAPFLAAIFLKFNARHTTAHYGLTSGAFLPLITALFLPFTFVLLLAAIFLKLNACHTITHNDHTNGAFLPLITAIFLPFQSLHLLASIFTALSALYTGTDATLFTFCRRNLILASEKYTHTATLPFQSLHLHAGIFTAQITLYTGTVLQPYFYYFNHHVTVIFLPSQTPHLRNPLQNLNVNFNVISTTPRNHCVILPCPETISLKIFPWLLPPIYELAAKYTVTSLIIRSDRVIADTITLLLKNIAPTSQVNTLTPCKPPLLTHTTIFLHMPISCLCPIAHLPAYGCENKFRGHFYPYAMCRSSLAITNQRETKISYCATHVDRQYKTIVTLNHYLPTADFYVSARDFDKLNTYLRTSYLNCTYANLNHRLLKGCWTSKFMNHANQQTISKPIDINFTWVCTLFPGYLHTFSVAYLRTFLTDHLRTFFVKYLRTLFADYLCSVFMYVSRRNSDHLIVFYSGINPPPKTARPEQFPYLPRNLHLWTNCITSTTTKNRPSKGDGVSPDPPLCLTKP
jgi:hypothetical protein